MLLGQSKFNKTIRSPQWLPYSRWSRIERNYHITTNTKSPKCADVNNFPLILDQKLNDSIVGTYNSFWPSFTLS